MGNSGNWTERFRAVMPWGSSTCSKAPKLEPDEPSVIVRGKGCRVWDDRGREFIDFRNSLGPVTLGYAFPATDDAIREQLGDGIVYGHPHPLECEVAEMLCDAIPCAEQARFLKTGGEAMAACIRMARAFTGRDHVVQIGYNGWLNSLAAGGRALPSQVSERVPPGVPRALSDLHHSGPWNDADALAKILGELNGQVAAIAVSADYRTMAEGETFYPALRKLADEHGAVLIFDEIVTGFRVALGGVQEYFGVTPDLTVFAKGIANGMPLSVYAGRREIMEVLDRVIVSSTYGGEALSLASARATIRTYRDEGVINHLWAMGERMWSGFSGLAEKVGVPVKTEGLWPCPAVVFGSDAPDGLREQFYRAAYRNGVSLFSVNYVNFSHKEGDIDEAIERLEKALGEL